jgi:hypothetical protein
METVRMVDDVLIMVAGRGVPADRKLSSTARRSSVPDGWKTQS